MNAGTRVVLCGTFSVTTMGAPLAQAQEVTGVLGSPSATTTISGKQLPAADPKFGRGNNASHYWRANQS